MSRVHILRDIAELGLDPKKAYKKEDLDGKGRLHTHPVAPLKQEAPAEKLSVEPKAPNIEETKAEPPKPAKHTKHAKVVEPAKEAEAPVEPAKE